MGECECHLYPPCEHCVSMTEEEADAAIDAAAATPEATPQEGSE